MFLSAHCHHRDSLSALFEVTFRLWRICAPKMAYPHPKQLTSARQLKNPVWDQIQVPSWDCTSRSIFWDGLSRLGRTSGRSRIRKENSLRRVLDLPLGGWRAITLSTSSIRSEAVPRAGWVDLSSVFIGGGLNFSERTLMSAHDEKFRPYPQSYATVASATRYVCVWLCE
jgi:hypothetical protein